jgi:hypothetical protein
MWGLGLSISISSPHHQPRMHPYHGTSFTHQLQYLTAMLRNAIGTSIHAWLSF